MLRAIIWIDGNDINYRLSGHAACVYSIVPVMQNKQFKVTIPCMGDRSKTLAQNDKLIFSSPIEKVTDLVMGLEALIENNSGLLTKFLPMLEHDLSESYIKMGKLIGMDMNK